MVSLHVQCSLHLSPVLAFHWPSTLDPLVRGMDPWFRIWIHTKMSWIRNTGCLCKNAWIRIPKTAYLNCSLSGSVRNCTILTRISVGSDSMLSSGLMQEEVSILRPLVQRLLLLLLGEIAVTCLLAVPGFAAGSIHHWTVGRKSLKDPLVPLQEQCSNSCQIKIK